MPVKLKKTFFKTEGRILFWCKYLNRGVRFFGSRGKIHRVRTVRVLRVLEINIWLHGLDYSLESTSKSSSKNFDKYIKITGKIWRLYQAETQNWKKSHRICRYRNRYKMVYSCNPLDEEAHDNFANTCSSEFDRQMDRRKNLKNCYLLGEEQSRRFPVPCECRWLRPKRIRETPELASRGNPVRYPFQAKSLIRNRECWVKTPAMDAQIASGTESKNPILIDELYSKMENHEISLVNPKLTGEGGSMCGREALSATSSWIIGGGEPTRIGRANFLFLGETEFNNVEKPLRNFVRIISAREDLLMSILAEALLATPGAKLNSSKIEGSNSELVWANKTNSEFKKVNSKPVCSFIFFALSSARSRRPGRVLVRRLGGGSDRRAGDDDAIDVSESFGQGWPSGRRARYFTSYRRLSDKYVFLSRKIPDGFGSCETGGVLGRTKTSFRATSTEMLCIATFPSTSGSESVLNTYRVLLLAIFSNVGGSEKGSISVEGHSPDGLMVLEAGEICGVFFDLGRFATFFAARDRTACLTAGFSAICVCFCPDLGVFKPTRALVREIGTFLVFCFSIVASRAFCFSWKATFSICSWAYACWEVVGLSKFGRGAGFVITTFIILPKLYYNDKRTDKINLERKNLTLTSEKNSNLPSGVGGVTFFDPALGGGTICETLISKSDIFLGSIGWFGSSSAGSGCRPSILIFKLTRAPRPTWIPVRNYRKILGPEMFKNINIKKYAKYRPFKARASSIVLDIASIDTRKSCSPFWDLFAIIFSSIADSRPDIIRSLICLLSSHYNFNIILINEILKLKNSEKLTFTNLEVSSCRRPNSWEMAPWEMARLRHSSEKCCVEYRYELNHDLELTSIKPLLNSRLAVGSSGMTCKRCLASHRTDKRFSAVKSFPAIRSVYVSPRNRDKPSGTKRSKTFDVIEVLAKKRDLKRKAREKSFSQYEKFRKKFLKNINSPENLIIRCSNSLSSSSSGSTQDSCSKLARRAVLASERGSTSNPVPGIWTLGPGAGITEVALLIYRTVSSSRNFRILKTWLLTTGSLESVRAVADLSNRRNYESIKISRNTKNVFQLKKKNWISGTYVIEPSRIANSLHVGRNRFQLLCTNFSFFRVTSFHNRRRINTGLKKGTLKYEVKNFRDEKNRWITRISTIIFKTNLPGMIKHGKTSRGASLSHFEKSVFEKISFLKTKNEDGLEIIGENRLWVKNVIIKRWMTQDIRKTKIIPEKRNSLMKKRDVNRKPENRRVRGTCRKCLGAGKREKSKLKSQSHLEQLVSASGEANFLFFILLSRKNEADKNKRKIPEPEGAERKVSHSASRVGSSHQRMSQQPQRIRMRGKSSTPITVKIKSNIKRHFNCLRNSLSCSLEHELKIIHYVIKLGSFGEPRGG